MRKNPYSDRSHLEIDGLNSRPRQSADFIYQPLYKQDINKLYNNIVAYLPNHSRTTTQNLLFQRGVKPAIKRPLTVNRTYSELKNKSIFALIQTRTENQLRKIINNYGYPLYEKGDPMPPPKTQIKIKVESIVEAHGELRIGRKCKQNKYEKLVDIAMHLGLATI